MICNRGGFITQRHNELHDLEADLLNMVCNHVETELQQEQLHLKQLTISKINEDLTLNVYSCTIRI